jgi:signal transduction histidine kinase
VTQHRGTIAVRSAPGNGSSFEVKLPEVAAVAGKTVTERSASPVGP